VQQALQRFARLVHAPELDFFQPVLFHAAHLLRRVVCSAQARGAKAPESESSGNKSSMFHDAVQARDDGVAGCPIVTQRW
jgi:hypothetical protein